MSYGELLIRIDTLRKVIRDLENQICTKKRDKVGLYFKAGDVRSGSHFSAATVSFDAYHGYYGNSSCGDDMSTELQWYVVAALNHLKSAIIEKAKSLILDDIKRLAMDASAEAKKIIEIAEDTVKEEPEEK